MSLSILIVDDEALARSRLRHLLSSCVDSSKDLVFEAADTSQALALLSSQRIGLVLLDIHMPGIDGLRLAKTILQQAGSPAVVFVTAHAEHALEAFDLEAADYLTKPVRLERLQQALEKVIRRRDQRQQLQEGKAALLNATQEYLLLHDGIRMSRVPLHEVLYFKAELKYITVRTAIRSYVMEGSLHDLEHRHAQQFLRIHRNALIARHAISCLEKHFDAEEGEGWAVRLHGLSDLLAVSRRQLSAVREAMASP